MEVPQEGFVSRYLNRRISRPMSRLLARTPLTPNQVSVASFAIALASFALFLGGHNIWAGLAAQASSIVDGADGDLARLKDMATKFGGFFDAVLDRYADIAIIAGLVYWAYAFESGTPATLVGSVGLLAIVGALMVSYTRARAEASLGSAFHGLAGSLASRDARLFLIMIGAILGQALATLAVLAVLTNAVVIWQVALAARRSHTPAPPH